MRNRYPGICYRCQQPVAVGAGHFELFRGGWRTQHAECAIQFRGTPDPERAKDQMARMVANAALTGKKGQRARKLLKDMQV